MLKFGMHGFTFCRDTQCSYTSFVVAASFMIMEISLLIDWWISSSGDLSGDLQNIESPQTWDSTPDLCGDISFIRTGNLPRGLPQEWVSAYAGILTKGGRGYEAGPYPGIYKKNVPHSPRQYQGLYLGRHKVQN